MITLQESILKSQEISGPGLKSQGLSESVLNKPKQKSVRDYDYYVNSGKFNERQLLQIKRGFDNGLKPEHIALYAKPEKDSNWMFGAFQIALYAPDRKLSDEDIKTLLNPEFTNEQNTNIWSILTNGKLSNEQLMFLANPKFPWRHMLTIREGFEKGVSVKQLKQFDLIKFNDDQVELIIWGLRIGLSMQQIKKYAKPQYKVYKMEEMLHEIAKENGLGDKLPKK